MTVTLQRLRYFVAVAEELSFTRAATRLYVSQPSLSEQVRRLEEGIGVTLLLRTTRSVELTEAGRAYLEDARGVLADLDRARERALAIQTASGSAVRISYTASVAYEALPLVLDELAGARPDLDAVTERRTTQEAVGDVLLGDADLALVREFAGAPGVVSRTVRHERLAAFASTRSPLAGRGALRVDDLRDQTIVVVPADVSPGFHDVVGRLCATRGFAPAQVALPGLTDREPLMARLARLDGHVFVGPASIARVEWEGVACIPFSDPDATIALDALWREDGPSPAGRAALDAVLRVAAAERWTPSRPTPG